MRLAMRCEHIHAATACECRKLASESTLADSGRPDHTDDSAVAARQDRRPLTYKLIGCHPNRATLDTITSSRLQIEDVRHGEVPKVPSIERPMIIGTARLAQTG